MQLASCSMWVGCLAFVLSSATFAENNQTTEAQKNVVLDALEEALAATEVAPPPPPIPPVTADELSNFKESIDRCWQIVKHTSYVTIVVAVSFREDATPIPSTIRLKSFSGGDFSTAQNAFIAARDAIIGCGINGYDLPANKFKHWQNVEMTFHSER